MLGNLKYSGACAAVRGAMGGLLSQGMWKRLLSASSADELVSVLNETRYQRELAEATGNIRQMERQLRASLWKRIGEPLPFLGMKGYRLVYWLWRSRELEWFFELLRTIHKSGGRFDSRLAPVRPAGMKKLDWRELSKAGSISALTRRLTDSNTGNFYSKALNRAYKEYGQDNSLFALESALQLSYYRKLKDIIGGLWGRDRKEADRFVGERMDFKNLVWTMRCREYFNFSPESNLGRALPRSDRIDDETLRGAATGDTVEEMVAEIWKDKLPKPEHVRVDSQREAILWFEWSFKRYLADRARKTLWDYRVPSHLGIVLAYCLLLEFEVDDLVKILEGVENGVSSQKIQTFLVSYPAEDST